MGTFFLVKILVKRGFIRDEEGYEYKENIGEGEGFRPDRM